jgi:hypothetical protein
MSMYYLRSYKLYLFVIFFSNLLYGYSPQFNVDLLKRNSVTTEKKIKTVVMKKKGFAIGSFFKSLKNLVGLSGFFERVVPRSWKRVFGFQRASFIRFLTMVTALANVSLIGYFLFCKYPLVTFNMVALFGNKPQPLQQRLIEPPIIVQKPSMAPEPLVVVKTEPVQPLVKIVNQKMLGEFE